MSDDPTHSTAPASDARLEVDCPCCDARLVVDARTGSVISHEEAEEPLAGGADFDRLLADLDTQKERAAKRFDQEKAAFDDRDRLLEERFKAALERAADAPDDEPPPRPFDLD